MWGRLRGKTLRVIFALGIFGCLSLRIASSDSSYVHATGKKKAYMGNPASKRGVELGFDQGYLAAKSDQKASLKPDMNRHQAYQDPNKYYRYEFGGRSNFNRGFLAGFRAGYRQVLGKSVPSGSSKSKSYFHSAGGSSKVKKSKPKSSTNRIRQSRVVSDAL